MHLISNSQGELLACRITLGNTDNREPLPELTKDLFGKLFDDKDYLAQSLFEELFANGLQLITGIKKNMKNKTRAEHRSLIASKFQVFNDLLNCAL